MPTRVQAGLVCCVLGLGLSSCTGPASLADARRVHSGPARICYRGTQTLAGHLSQPGEMLKLGMTLELFSGGDAEPRGLVASTWSPDAADAPERELFWLDGERVIRTSPEGETAQASTWEASWVQKLVGLEALPHEISAHVPHPTIGDIVELIQPSEANRLDGLTAPRALSLAHATDSTRWTAEVEREPCPAGAKLDAAPRLAPLPAAEPQPITWTTLEPGLELASLPDSDIVSLVVELADSLVVCEAGLTVHEGERFVDALRERFPNKPIAHVLFSHHHPHYTGGLRAFIAAGAVIHAPTSSAAFVAQLAALPFELAPDRLARTSPKATPHIEPFDGRLELYDAGRLAVEAIDIGLESNHTAAYVLTYLPRSKLLFQGDLGWFPAAAGQSGTIRAGRRARGLQQAVRARGLLVERLVQSWPRMGANQVITRPAFEAAVKERDAPDPPAP